MLQTPSATETSDVLALMDDWGPEKVVCVSDTRTGMRGVLVIDNTARGIGKGGTRMSPTVTVTEIARLARVMTLKWAAVDMFYGGAKAGIAADPAAADKEAVLRAFARALHNEVPAEYVFGLDMGLTEDDAAIILDEIGRNGVVGTPAALGGLPYDQLGITGLGVAEAAHAAAQWADLDIAASRVAVQGFGAVGAAASARLVELGATVCAISTTLGCLYNPTGLDTAALLTLRDVYGDALVEHYPDAQRLDLGAELLADVDILVPAATQDVIDDDTARDIKARIVVEGANLPTSAAAQQLLHDRGILLVPDFIANAGGVIAAGYAMDSRQSAFRPDPEPVRSTVADKLRSNTVTVLDAARRTGATTHDTARALAHGRVHAAMSARRRLPAAAAPAQLR